MEGYRIAFIKLAVAAGFLILLAKIATVMVFSGEYYRGLASGNRMREEKILANRGVIYDRNGKILAQNLPQFVLNGKVISKEEARLEKEVKVESIRFYPYGEIFAHAAGYANLTDRKGVTGLEEEYDKKLTGKDGKELWETEANGKKLRLLGRQEAVAGENLVTSLDANLQETLFKSLKGLNSLKGLAGAAVATDPRTGEVLALVSVPAFDPNKVEEALTKEGEPFFNRAVMATYPPGSTFKIVTAAAGLENGVIDRETKFEATGILVIGPYKFANWKYLRNGGVDGWINVMEALQKSNDVFFYQLGGKIGAEKLEEMAKKFGLGPPAGMIRREREWYLGDTYHLAVGQGDLLVTPMQVNNWTRAIANGGKELGLKKETAEIIKEGMRRACETGGTAWPLFGMKMFCKTGTAEYGDSQNGTHAWLTGFIEGEKPLVITVLVEGGGEGSDVAAPIVKKAVEEWIKGE